MDPSQSTLSSDFNKLPLQSPQAFWSGAVHFWEPRRILYNAVLIAVVVAWLTLTWPHFRPAFSFLNLGRLCMLGLIANVLYCAAYFAEVPLQCLGPAKRSRRWVLWSAGMLLAFLLTNYWIADEIYPFVN